MKQSRIQIRRYRDFLDRVEELGFMAFSNMIPGFPSLSDETPGEIWHTGDTDTDPWRWKDRAAEEKKLAFGCILGGYKGFVSARMYPVFYAACHPEEAMEERRYSGLVNQTVWQLWKLFEEKSLLDTSKIRREMDVSKKKGGNRVDSAIRELQQHYYITVSGSVQKIDKHGMPYGWHVNTYDKVTNWVPQEWFQSSPCFLCEEARKAILDAGVAIGRNINRKELANVLWK